MLKSKEKLFYTMGEVSEMFDVNHSLIRFWEQRFDILKPKKNKKGNRLFTPVDIKNLEVIYHLVKERGMTLSGAEKYMKEHTSELERDTEVVRRLQEVRSILMEIKEELKDEDIALENEHVETTESLQEPETVDAFAQNPQQVSEHLEMEEMSYFEIDKDNELEKLEDLSLPFIAQELFTLESHPETESTTEQEQKYEEIANLQQSLF